MFDRNATRVLPKGLRKWWGAFAVDGDGNCFWRALARSLWGSEHFWLQVKLVVLAYGAVNAESLVGEGRHLHNNKLYYSVHVYEKYRFVVDGTHYDALDDCEMMLLTEIGGFCKGAAWGGGLTSSVASDAMGFTVKLLHPADMMSRKRYEASNWEGRGTGRKGLTCDDQRVSRTYVPSGEPTVWCLRGANGKHDTYREEVTITLTESGRRVAEAELLSIPEVDMAMELGKLNHFASVMRLDGSSPPFPVHKSSPYLYAFFVSG